MFTRQGLVIICTLLASAISTSSFADFRRSIIQKEENNIYIAIGGGGGGLNTGSWDSVLPQKSFVFDGTTYKTPPLNQPNNKTEATANGMAAIGYSFEGVPFRLELAYNFIGEGTFEWDNLIEKNATIDPMVDLQTQTKVFSNTLMLNGYLDFIVTEKFMPFIMAGLGWGINSAQTDYTLKIPEGTPPFENKIDVNATSDRVYTSNFVWNVGLGMNYALSENWSAGIQGTYFYLGKMDVDAFNEVTQQDVQIFSVDRLDAFIATANLAYHF